MQWKNKTSLKTATIGKNGFAWADGLDGEYQVTLLDTPSGYTYDPNIYKANNYEPSVQIELLKLIPTTGSGMNLYQNIITIRSLGAYRATFARNMKDCYFQYKMTSDGTYSVESIMDLTANEINPYIDRYTANNEQFKAFIEMVDTGGTENTYTKNFKLIYTVNDYDAENSGNFAFGVHFENRVEVKYPVYIDFILKRDGEYDYSEDGYRALPKTPEEELIQAPEETGTLTPVRTASNECKVDYTETVEGETYHYTTYKRYMKADGGDGYYHFFDPEKNKYGPTIYVSIKPVIKASTTDYVLDVPFYVMGQYESTSDVMHPIIHYGSLTYVQVREWDPNTNKYSKKAAYDYSQVIQGTFLTTQAGYIQRDTSASGNFKEYLKDPHGQKGYADYCNSDGVYPATEELRVFLKGFSDSQDYFDDGAGWAEEMGLQASEYNIWLWACCYYRN